VATHWEGGTHSMPNGRAMRVKGREHGPLCANPLRRPLSVSARQRGVGGIRAAQRNREVEGVSWARITTPADVPDRARPRCSMEPPQEPAAIRYVAWASTGRRLRPASARGGGAQRQRAGREGAKLTSPCPIRDIVFAVSLRVQARSVGNEIKLDF